MIHNRNQMLCHAMRTAQQASCTWSGLNGNAVYQ